ncbi:MAG: hypothetical protein KatS3mg104_1668 [Phycisphaerae bacterium]|jgi:uncharacterized repeat protein (TIGR04138 family)|nr:MAG: hypothetical protein KatS3mg104_1668 [Phycisphaerae bacterium]
MPEPPISAKSIETLAAEMHYAPEAFIFVQEGLKYTSDKLHGTKADLTSDRHVTGRELSEGLRELAIARWGMLARLVLERWGIFSTMDFGRIVYAMISAGLFSKTDQDTIEDFRNVYDFRKAFDSGYQIRSERVNR